MIHILAVGYCPLKSGGVAIHVRRMGDYIRRIANDLEYDICHFERCGFDGCSRETSGQQVAAQLLKGRYDILCFYCWPKVKHLLWAWAASFLSRTRIVFSVRNDRFKEKYESLSWPKRWLVRLFFRRVCWVHAINRHTDLLFIDEAKIVSFPGYIPPAAVEIDPQGLPQEILDFLNRYPVKLAANASRLWQHNGVDLYGLDICVKLMERLAHERQDVGLVFVVVEVDSGSRAYWAEIEQRIEERGLEGRILLWRGGVPFPALINAVDIVLRPTTTDGDAATVREALDLKKRVVASDAVVRPSGTLLFKNRDLEDLHAVVSDAIVDVLAGENGIDFGDGNINAEIWLEFWRRVSQGREMVGEWHR
jgi:glycosyltransferase involved in cell wall biosynthesis